MLPEHLNNAPESIYVEKEQIDLKKLDSIFSVYCNNEKAIYMLKIDTQGNEKKVLEGSINSTINEITKIAMIMTVKISVIKLAR